MKLQSKILAILCAVAIFIPSLVAIISYNSTNKAPVSDKNVRSMSVSDLSGTEFSFEKGKSEGDDEMIDLFLAMNESAEKVSGLPDPLVGTPFFKVVRRTNAPRFARIPSMPTSAGGARSARGSVRCRRFPVR